MSLKTIEYRPEGTCCAIMNVVLDDNTIKDVKFVGGCPGNLEGIRHLISGMNINDVILKLQGIRCGMKPTSCPDQLSRCLLEYKQQSEAKEVLK